MSKSSNGFYQPSDQEIVDNDNKININQEISYKSNQNTFGFLTSITKPWMYPNILTFIKNLNHNSCVVCNTKERIYLQSQIKTKAFLIDLDSLEEIIIREKIDLIFILDASRKKCQKEKITELIKSKINKNIPVYDIFFDVLIGLSVKNSFNLISNSIQNTNQIKKYFLVCTPRSGSTLLCDLLVKTNQFGFPKEHFTKPIYEAIRRKYFSFDTWFNFLLFSSTKHDNVMGTKLISERLVWLEEIIDFGYLEQIFDGAYIFILKRQNLVSQAVSLYFSQLSSTWHLNGNKTNNQEDFKQINYNFSKIVKQIEYFINQENLIETFIRHLNLPKKRIIRIYYEDIVRDKVNVLKKFSESLNIPIEQNIFNLSSNYQKFSSERKNEIINQFYSDCASRGWQIEAEPRSIIKYLRSS